MYDFLDYFIRVTKHNNNSVQELAQSLQGLREFERGKVPPPSTPNPPSNTPPTKPNNPTPSNPTKKTNADNAGQVAKEIYTLRQKTKAHPESIINKKSQIKTMGKKQ